MRRLVWRPGKRSDVAGMDLYTRWTLLFILWLAVAITVAFSLVEPVRAVASPLVIGVAIAGAVVQGALCGPLLKQALIEWIRREGLGVDPGTASRDAAWRRRAGAAGAVTTLTVAAVLTLMVQTGLRANPTAWVMPASAMGPLLSVYALVERRIDRVALTTGVYLLVVAGAVALVDPHWAITLKTVLPLTWILVCLVFVMRCSAWQLTSVWRLHDAKEVQSRLAVAEERLRFGRDLHDVLGRNLAVIALKSELAVELAQRGRPEATEQMVEVQRIAQQAQRDVKDVVRGYRRPDLAVELAGARGVLEAAGITCRMRVDEGSTMPLEVQSALAWVVREGTTNVLRHGDARHCTLRLTRSAEGEAVLTVENDGAPEATGCGGQRSGTGGEALPGSGGSGIVGLRERLKALNGALEAGPLDEGRFRLTARIPLARVGNEPSAVVGGAARPSEGKEAAA
jgi:two-component system, NarL family, sensor histidine kinase DesK